jgi:hypothetical protein
MNPSHSVILVLYLLGESLLTPNLAVFAAPLSRREPEVIKGPY